MLWLGTHAVAVFTGGAQPGAPSRGPQAKFAFLERRRLRISISG